ncbi:MAG TPA: RuvX/YqgF family protein, partial [Acidimicrobiales bacterium]|nr:RuvX/YqgF family protein [Acidimicrobiales bacterium]
MRVLALDLGSRRIGIAVTDATGAMAFPRGHLERGPDHATDHRRLAERVAEEEAGLVVVGLPLSLSGRTGPAA